MHSEFLFDLKVGQSSCQITQQLYCRVRPSELSESETVTFQRNKQKSSSNVLSWYGTRYYIAACPEPVKIPSTHTSFSREKYEDFRIYFVWTSDLPMRAACIIEFIFFV
jgi:hypothetical protein